LHLSNGAGRFLRFLGGEPTTNLLRVIHPDLRIEVSTALYAARAESQDQTRTARAVLDENSSARLVRVRVRTVREPTGARGYFLVLFEEFADEPEQSDNATSPNDKVAEPSPASDAAHQLEQEVARLQAQLRATVDQYEASLEELKASNEELQAVNEEMRSATEELETSKEELQSVNEELSTANLELKNRVEEVSRANADLQNLMASTDIATLFLDRQLRIKRYTSTAEALFHLIPTDVGRPLAHVTHRLDYADLPDDAANVLGRLAPVEREVRSRDDERYFLARLLPYRTEDDRIDGVVVTFVEFTERKRVEERLRQSYERTVEILESISDAFYAVDAEFRFTYINKKAEEMWGRSRDELLGKHYWTEFPQTVGSESYHKHLQAMAERTVLRFETVSPLLGRWVSVGLYPEARGGLSCYFQDISERKQNEEALRASEERFRTLLSKGADAITIADRAGNITYASPSIEAVTGYRAEEFVGQNPFHEQIHPDDLPRCEAVLGNLPTTPAAAWFCSIGIATNPARGAGSKARLPACSTTPPSPA
jgi:two-component system CheB/CheR fusion protein